MQSITVVPRAPQYIEGVTNLRGTVVPVVSLHTRLNIPSTEESNNKRIIIINSHGITAGLIVDEVNSVSYVLGKDIEASQTLDSIHSSFIRSIAKIEGKLIILLDLENVLKERQ
ncbi:MAG: chemotaxis protein CheW, partial [Sedimentisphaerales bacterium]|nr:chemotaxis protein CheW [Sedimentisphaerales bacterium]